MNETESTMRKFCHQDEQDETFNSHFSSPSCTRNKENVNVDHVDDKKRKRNKKVIVCRRNGKYARSKTYVSSLFMLLLLFTTSSMLQSLPRTSGINVMEYLNRGIDWILMEGDGDSFAVGTAAGTGDSNNENDHNNKQNRRNFLSIIEISELRVRDMKRRLARHHGYGADEIGRMIDKKELINALSYEEHRSWQKEQERNRRIFMKKSIMMALVCVIVIMFRPLFYHIWEVASVNFVVYTDKKKYEMSRCSQLQSRKAVLGIFLMLFLDGLQFWLSITVLLSWVLDTKSSSYAKYFFPIPSLPIKPAQLLTAATNTASGQHITANNNNPLSNYGLNIGPMCITWALRYIHHKVETWTGRVLAEAQRKLSKQERKERRKKEKLEELERERLQRKAERAARRREREEIRKRKEQMANTAAAAAASADHDTDHDHNSSKIDPKTSEGHIEMDELD